MRNENTFDLHAVELFEDGLMMETLPDGHALGTFSTTSTLGSASCPVSSAGSVMSANCQGG
ncbi:thiocillin family RiPP [Amycolatopsis sp. NPDC059657]|uniref:thiocillin family RiPP n=1 Tax=Amycolatopsis sp. NPDC059657 TaxID=3346899 RepID=UPI0036705C33